MATREPIKLNKRKHKLTKLVPFCVQVICQFALGALRIHPLFYFAPLGTTFPSLLWELHFGRFGQREALAESWEKKMRVYQRIFFVSLLPFLSFFFFFFLFFFFCFDFYLWQWVCLLSDSGSFGEAPFSVVTAPGRVPTQGSSFPRVVFKPLLWEQHLFLCPSNHGSDSGFLLLLISGFPHHHLVNTSIICITDSFSKLLPLEIPRAVSVLQPGSWLIEWFHLDTFFSRIAFLLKLSSWESNQGKNKDERTPQWKSCT